MNIENVSMRIILHAGNAKNHLHEALQDARNAAFHQIESKMKQASDELLEAHKLQTKFIQKDTGEGLKTLPVLLVHAQDHLMTVMSEKTLIEEMVEVYRNQHELKRKVDHLMEGSSMGKSE
ncbi:PTS system, cellobiose-specific IIA component [Lentibacillus halodurans]|uniref:PTS system, cellobiose-specific IIA component n=1 Tax=Lentibacillus halodurans TaxID=237679 RepID=A0A1I1AMT8_9BACI|nr:PTS lactose/cellobiose transporter subunit IIA [Lentibacillus halodurans]SFB39257.1 PTS system, cellobiose-specific IIA component [Lentibacillus halodurans]